MPNDQKDWTRAASEPLLLDSVTATAGNTSSKSIAVPFGIVTIGYAANFSGSNGSPTNVRITGDQTLVTYRNDSNPGIPPVRAALLKPNDTSVTAQLTAPGAAPAQVDVYGWMVPVTTTVTADIATPVPVTFLDVAAGFTAQSAPWQRPTRTVDVGVALAASPSSAVLIAAVGGLTIYLHTVELHCSAGAANAIQLQDTNGTALGQGVAPVASAPAIGPADRKGFALAIGTGLQVANIVGGAIGAVRGYVDFRQE